MIINSSARLLQVVLLAFAVTAIGAPARAQQPSANAIAMAKEIIVAKGSATLFNTIGNNVIEQSKAMLLQTNPTLTKDLDDVAAKLRSDYAARMAEPLNDAAKLYAAGFTEQELKDILAFYKSPAGKKVADQETGILEHSLSDLDAWAAKFSEEVLARIRGEMRKRGHEL
jgi:uncharacterized protein